MTAPTAGHLADEANAGQILDGAKAITKYLDFLGFSEMTERRVFHWAADGRLPVKIGLLLISGQSCVISV